MEDDWASLAICDNPQVARTKPLLIRRQARVFTLSTRQGLSLLERTDMNDSNGILAAKCSAKAMASRLGHAGGSTVRKKLHL